MPDLDLSDLIPNTVEIKVGGDTYQVRADLTPTQRVRISAWWGSYTAALNKVEGAAVSDDELWAIVAELLGAESADKVRGYGTTVAQRILDFLLDAQNTRDRQSTTPWSATRSDSAATTPAA